MDETNERRDVLKNFLADRAGRNFNAEFFFDAGDEQQDVERIEVDVAAEERHVGRDLRVGPELEIAAQNEFDALANVFGGTARSHRGGHFPPDRASPQASATTARDDC